MRSKASEIRSSDSLILKIVHELKNKISQREKEIARAMTSDSYTRGRHQGSLDGLDESLAIIEAVLIGEDEKESL